MPTPRVRHSTNLRHRTTTTTQVRQVMMTCVVANRRNRRASNVNKREGKRIQVTQIVNLVVGEEEKRHHPRDQRLSEEQLSYLGTIP